MKDPRHREGGGRSRVRAPPTSHASVSGGRGRGKRGPGAQGHPRDERVRMLEAGGGDFCDRGPASCSVDVTATDPRSGQNTYV